MSVIDNIVDRLHVGTSNRQVIRAIWLKLKPASRTRKVRKERHRAYRAALQRHAKNRELYVAVVSGNIGNKRRRK
jgi:hypothetical protein